MVCAVPRTQDLISEQRLLSHWSGTLSLLCFFFFFFFFTKKGRSEKIYEIFTQADIILADFFFFKCQEKKNPFPAKVKWL